MTDEKKPPEEKQPENKEDVSVADLVKLRDELQEQFSTLKKSFEDTVAEKDKEIETLTAHAKELERALVRSATTEPQTTEPEKTEEEKKAEAYKKWIEDLAKTTLEKQKLRY